MIKLIKILMATFLFSTFASANIIDASTDAALFIDSYVTGPENKPVEIYNYKDFAFQFGNNANVEQYFRHGGQFAVVINSKDIKTGLDSIPDKLSGVVNTLVMPSLRNLPEAEARPTRMAALKVATDLDMMVIIDPPKDLTLLEVVKWKNSATELAGQSRVALYYPDLIVKDPISKKETTIGPSAVLAGIFSTTDNNEGVFVSPAGMNNGKLKVVALTAKLSEQDRTLLYSDLISINPIVNFTEYGNIVYGARTAGGTDDLKYISVQRTLTNITQSLIQSFAWTVFEPAGPLLRSNIRADVSGYLTQLYLKGGLYGSTAASSFQVVCDSTNNTDQDDANGVQNLSIKVALTRPGEFILINIALKTLPISR